MSMQLCLDDGNRVKHQSFPMCSAFRHYLLDTCRLPGAKFVSPTDWVTLTGSRPARLPLLCTVMQRKARRMGIQLILGKERRRYHYYFVLDYPRGKWGWREGNSSVHCGI